MSIHDADDDNDYDAPGPGWVKKSTGLWEYQGPPGLEDPYGGKSMQQIQKEEEELQRQSAEEVRRLKAAGAIPEDEDMDRNEMEGACPGCSELILPRHWDKCLKQTYLHVECSVCNVGFTDTSLRYTEIFTLFGGVEVKDKYRVGPQEIP
jgi:hypothetical protein